MPRRPQTPAPKLTLFKEAGVALPPRLRALAQRCLTAAAREYRYASVNFALVGESTMRILNRTYRRHDRVTDVLSFTYENRPIVGEIVICLAQAERQARRRRHNLTRELNVLMVHGLMHLGGHDHMKLAERKVMRAAEVTLLARVQAK